MNLQTISEKKTEEIFTVLPTQGQAIEMFVFFCVLLKSFVNVGGLF